MVPGITSNGFLLFEKAAKSKSEVGNGDSNASGQGHTKPNPGLWMGCSKPSVLGLLTSGFASSDP